MHCQDRAFSSSLLASAASHKPGMLKWPNSESQNENWNGQKIDNVSQGKIVMLIYSDPLCKMKLPHETCKEPVKCQINELKFS